MMESAEMKLIRFNQNDVITTSGGFTMSGAGDGIADNLQFNGTLHDNDATYFQYNSNVYDWASIKDNEAEDLAEYNNLNGTYKWDNTISIWGSSGAYVKITQ